MQVREKLQQILSHCYRLEEVIINTQYKTEVDIEGTLCLIKVIRSHNDLIFQQDSN